MNWDQIEARWEQFRGKALSQWGRLNHSDVDVVAGRRTELAGAFRSATAWRAKTLKTRSILDAVALAGTGRSRARSARDPHGALAMLQWALTFFVLAIIAGVLALA